jgi:hypothetical protein
MYLIYTPKTASSGSGRLDDTKSHPQGELRGATKFVKGKGTTSRKKEIKPNWASDPNMKSEYGFERERPDRGPKRSPAGRDSRGDEARQKTKALPHPILGRYHGFSTTGLSLSEFEKIIDSLHPIRP